MVLIRQKRRFLGSFEEGLGHPEYYFRNVAAWMGARCFRYTLFSLYDGISRQVGQGVLRVNFEWRAASHGEPDDSVAIKTYRCGSADTPGAASFSRKAYL